MELPDKFYEKSTVLKIYVEMIYECLEDKALCNVPEFGMSSNSFEGMLNYHITDLHERLRLLTEAMMQANRLTKNNRLMEARLSLKNSHQFSLFDGYKQTYRNIKSLLTGLIYTSSIFKKGQLSEYKKAWADYHKETDDSEKLSDHQRMYLEFKKVETIEELINFNQFFKENIHRLIFEFTDELTGRMDYTIEYLHDAGLLQKGYKSEKQKLEKLINQSNRLKKQLKLLPAN